MDTSFVKIACGLLGNWCQGKPQQHLNSTGRQWVCRRPSESFPFFPGSQRASCSRENVPLIFCLRKWPFVAPTSKLLPDQPEDTGAQIPGRKGTDGFVTTLPSLLQNLASKTALGDYCLRFCKPPRAMAAVRAVTLEADHRACRVQVNPPGASLVDLGTEAAPAECSCRRSTNKLPPPNANSDLPSRFVELEISTYTHCHPL